MSTEARTQIERLLARELATAVDAKVPLTGWAAALTDSILTIIEQDTGGAA